MKACKLTWSDKIAVCGFVLFILMLFSGFFALLYQGERERTASQYVEKLDVPLQSPSTKDLHQIRGGLTKWLASYKELDVPSSYGEAYAKVEGALGEANELAQRLPTMTATEFREDLTSLQSRLVPIPRIGLSAYGDTNPWWTGFAVFTLKMLGLAMAACCLLAGMLYLSYRGASMSASTTTTSSSGSDCGSSGCCSAGAYYGDASYGSPPYGMPPYGGPPPYGIPGLDYRPPLNDPFWPPRL
jgi:hypothetical protein